MKAHGKRGYLMNIIKEHGDRGNSLIKSLNEDKKIQCVIVNDFVKADYINITKILFHLHAKGKMATNVDGLFIDADYAEYFTFCWQETFKHIVNNFVKPIIDTSLNKITDEGNDTDEQKERGDLGEKEKEQTMEKDEEEKEEDEPCVKGEDIINIDEEWRKVLIMEGEIGNVGDVILYDGTVQPVDKLTYYLNPCSVLAVHFLKVKKGDKVLDMCAAPGGKSIMIAKKLFGPEKSPLDRIRGFKCFEFGKFTDPCHILTEIECDARMAKYCTINKTGLLVCNEFYRSRYERLQSVLKKFVPKEIWNSNNLEITQFNGLDKNQFLRFRAFNKILVDAPCSTDGHLIQNEQILNRWTPSYIKCFANMQFQLLCNAFHLLKNGGVILYSTCALSPQENDAVIARFQKKYASSIKIIDFIQDEFQYRKKEAKKLHHKLNRHNCSNEILTSGCKLTPKDTTPKCKFLSFFERTTYGYISMPDKSPFGVLYICKIKKLPI